MTRAWTKSCAACCVRKDLSDVVQCKHARLSSFCNVVFESELIMKKLPQDFWLQLDGVIVDISIWMVKSCCRVGVAGKKRSLVFAKLSCRWCSFIHAEMSARQPEMPAATIGSLVEMRDKAVCHQHSNGREIPCALSDGTQWCSVCGEEEWSKNRSQRNPSDQLMCSGFLPSPGHLEGPASEIGFKPAKWNPCDAQWCEGGQEELMVNRVNSSR